MKRNIVKKIGLVGMMLSVFVLSGCGKSADQLKETQGNLSDRIDERTALMEEKVEDVGLVSGIRGMLAGGTSLKCVSTEDGEEWVTYTNGKNFRGEGMTDGEMQQVLSIDGSMYTWSDATKTGMKMEKKCLAEFQKDMGIAGNISDPEDDLDFSIDALEKEEESGRVNCAPSTQADFSVPQDVVFADQCAMLKQQMAGFKDQMQKMQQ